MIKFLLLLVNPTESFPSDGVKVFADVAMNWPLEMYVYDVSEFGNGCKDFESLDGPG